MKIIFALCVLCILGCSSVDVPDSRVEYRTENGFLRVYDPTQKTTPTPTPALTATPAPSNTPSTKEHLSTPSEVVPQKQITVRTSKKVQERLQQIHILTRK